MLLLLAEGMLVAAVFISPSMGEKLESVAASADRAWSGTEDRPGLRTRAAETAQGVYDDWIAPLWRGPQPPAAEPEFTACVDCHPDYATQRKFTVYMNHPLHAEIGMECVTCHPANPHPSPPHPQEAVCAECHTEVEDEEACGYCHPPGALPHFYPMGAPKSAAVQCDVCHPKGAFDQHGSEPLVPSEDLTGANDEACLACHQDTTCSSCHAEPHPPGWETTHGEPVGRNGATNCITCHTSAWCADRCHAVTLTNPFLPDPLPSTGVRP
jgi:hypothetical protein